jgi:hypothetical protein
MGGTGGIEPVCGNGPELESNDCVGESLDGVVHGLCTSDDECTGPDPLDQYTFEAWPESGTFEFALSWTGPSDLDLYLLSDDELLGAAAGADNPEVVSVDLREGQQLSVSVLAFDSNDAEQAYSVVVSP